MQEFREGEAESQSNVLQLILADQHHQGASSSELITHDKVIVVRVRVEGSLCASYRW